MQRLLPVGAMLMILSLIARHVLAYHYGTGVYKLWFVH
jgi:hypothetical protein